MAVYTHAFDPTAVSPNNLIPDEVHTLSATIGSVVVPEYGLFYTKSVVIQGLITQQFLTLGIDYVFLSLDSDITALTGFEVAGAIKILNQSINGNVSLTYQAVGGAEGENSSLTTQLRAAIATLGGAPVTWSEVLNKPQVYPTGPHTHNILTDLTGLNALQIAMNKIYLALVSTRVPVLSGAYLSDRIDKVLALIANLRKDVNKLANQFSNSSTLFNTLGPDFAIVNGVLMLSNSANTLKISNFASSVTNVQIGTTVPSVTLTWNPNSAFTSLSLNNGIGAIDPSLGSYTVSNANLTANTIYTLTASDGTHTTSQSVTVLFTSSLYWGISNAASLTALQIKALGNTALSGSFAKTVTYNCSGGTYPYYAYPASFGLPTNTTIATSAGNFKFSDYTITTINITNSAEVTQLYNVIRFSNLQTGSAITINWQ